MRFRIKGCLAVLTVASVASCGAKVVYVEGDETGEQDVVGSCETLCEKSAACSDPGTCASTCPLIAESATRTGCDDELLALFECFNELPDVCNPSPDSCVSEATAYGVCFSTFCIDHPNDPNCGFGG